jgi:hypothetical protein
MMRLFMLLGLFALGGVSVSAAPWETWKLPAQCTTTYSQAMEEYHIRCADGARDVTRYTRAMDRWDTRQIVPPRSPKPTPPGSARSPLDDH